MKLKLKILKEKDVKQSYVDWYKDDKVVRYSNNQYRSFTLEGQRKYVNSCINSKDINLYGIFDSDTHIGNILISGLSSLHKVKLLMLLEILNIGVRVLELLQFQKLQQKQKRFTN